jgi:homopolymeric O-antigen transport system permease protein
VLASLITESVYHWAANFKSFNMSENIRIDVPKDKSVGEGVWTTIISPHRGWLDWRLDQLWRYRDLVSLFVWRDFVSAYKQTLLGPAWHIIQPLLTTLTFTVIFGRVAKLSTDGVSPFMFYLVGTICWTYFSSNLSKISNTFISNAHLLGKVYFHRLAIPISVAVSNLITFGIQLGIFGVCFLFQHFRGGNIHLSGWIFCTPILLLMLAGYGLGGGIIVSALTTRYRDLANLVSFGITLAMYGTPVIYPSSSVPEKFHWVIRLNPLSPVFEGFRLAFLGVGDVNAAQLAVSFGMMVVVITVGLMLFTHVERTFMDTV